MQKDITERGFRVNPRIEIKKVYKQAKQALENMGLDQYTFGEFIEDMFEHTKGNLESYIIEKRVPDEFKIKSALQDPTMKDAILNLIGRKRLSVSIKSKPTE